LAKIACGNFGGHHFVDRRQKAWFLPATHHSFITPHKRRAKSVVFARW
jgi:hypothetical protein